jgi:hypothetical protein
MMANRGRTIEQRVSAFLQSNAGIDFCAACIARELGFGRSKTGDATARLEGSRAFMRGYRACSVCRRDRLVIRAGAA